MKRTSNQVSLEPYGYAQVSPAPAQKSFAVKGIDPVAEKQEVPPSTTDKPQAPYVLILVGSMLLIFLGLTALASSSGSHRGAASAPGQVTLHSSSGGVVQMFNSLDVQAQVIQQFPDGTECRKISGPVDGSVDGIAMYFDQLDCRGAIGFVNIKWIND